MSNFLIKNPNEIHVMIDLETLSTKPTARITEIGACVIKDVLAPNFNVFHCHLWDSVGSPDIDMNTIEWRINNRLLWKNSDQGAVDGLTAISGLDHWLKEVTDGGAKQLIMWSKGIDFDFPILSHFFSRYLPHYTPPWKYNAIRDMRTLMKVFYQFEIPRETIEHNAVADAIRQSKCLWEIAEFLKLQIDRSWDPMD